MRARVVEVREQLAAIVAALDPQSVPLPEAAPLWQAFDALERLGRAGKVLVARRVEESRVWERRGHRSAAEYLAAQAGASVGEARRELETSHEARRHPRGRSRPARRASLRCPGRSP